MKTIFEGLNKLLSNTKPPEKRLMRHSNERQIIDIATDNLSQCESGIELLTFLKDHHIEIAVLRGRFLRDYAPSDKTVYISVSHESNIYDPAITINLAGAIREVEQEYTQNFKRLGVEHGESIYVHREGKKFEDKLFWQTAIVYELGKQQNRQEFIDSFSLMGYSGLIDAYEHDLQRV